MSEKKISELAEASVLDGNEIIALVQDGVTKRARVGSNFIIDDNPPENPAEGLVFVSKSGVEITPLGGRVEPGEFFYVFSEYESNPPYVARLDPRTFEEIWRVDFPAADYTISGQIRADGSVAFWLAEQEIVTRYDKDGVFVDSTPMTLYPGYIRGSDLGQYAVFTLGSLYLVNADGTYAAEFPKDDAWFDTSDGSDFASRANRYEFDHENHLMVVNRNGFARVAPSGDVLWKVPMPQGVPENGPHSHYYHDGSMYATYRNSIWSYLVGADTSGEVRIDIKTGQASNISQLIMGFIDDDVILFKGGGTGDPEVKRVAKNGYDIWSTVINNTSWRDLWVMYDTPYRDNASGDIEIFNRFTGSNVNFIDNSGGLNGDDWMFSGYRNNPLPTPGVMPAYIYAGSRGWQRIGSV